MKLWACLFFCPDCLDWHPVKPDPRCLIEADDRPGAEVLAAERGWRVYGEVGWIGRMDPATGQPEVTWTPEMGQAAVDHVLKKGCG